MHPATAGPWWVLLQFRAPGDSPGLESQCPDQPMVAVMAPGVRIPAEKCHSRGTDMAARFAACRRIARRGHRRQVLRNQEAVADGAQEKFTPDRDVPW